MPKPRKTSKQKRLEELEAAVGVILFGWRGKLDELAGKLQEEITAHLVGSALASLSFEVRKGHLLLKIPLKK